MNRWAPRGRGRGEHDAGRFQAMVRRADRLPYATRCRLVADEVGRQRTARSPRAALAWLDSQLAFLGAAPGTVAHAVVTSMRQVRPGDPTMGEVRAWTVAVLRPTRADIWAAGSVSPAVWSLLMAPAPADDDELAWLADSVGVPRQDLAAVLEDGAASP